MAPLPPPPGSALDLAPCGWKPLVISLNCLLLYMNSTIETLLFDRYLIMYNLCVFTCIIFIFVFRCTHVRMSYVLNSHLLTYSHLDDGDRSDTDDLNDKLWRHPKSTTSRQPQRAVLVPQVSRRQTAGRMHGLSTFRHRFNYTVTVTVSKPLVVRSLLEKTDNASQSQSVSWCP